MTTLPRAALLLLVSLCFAAQAHAELKLGIFPRASVKETFQAFQPLAALLTKTLGEEVTLVVPKDFPTFWEGVKSKEYDLVHFNQLHYIKGHDDFGYRVILANEEGGERTMRGIVAVLADSGIAGLTDLKGKSVLFAGDKKAMASYIGPTALLRQAGLTAGGDYKEEFAKTPPAAAIGMFNKAADAAGIGDAALRMPAVTSAIDVAKVKVLAQTDPFIQLPWAVKGDLAADKAEKIQKTMAGLAKGDPVLAAAKVTAFFTATDVDFDKVREIVAASGVAP